MREPGSSETSSSDTTSASPPPLRCEGGTESHSSIPVPPEMSRMMENGELEKGRRWRKARCGSHGVVAERYKIGKEIHGSSKDSEERRTDGMPVAN